MTNVYLALLIFIFQNFQHDAQNCSGIFETQFGLRSSYRLFRHSGNLCRKHSLNDLAADAHSGVCVEKTIIHVITCSLREIDTVLLLYIRTKN